MWFVSCTLPCQPSPSKVMNAFLSLSSLNTTSLYKNLVLQSEPQQWANCECLDNKPPDSVSLHRVILIRSTKYCAQWLLICT